MKMQFNDYGDFIVKHVEAKDFWYYDIGLTSPL